MKEQQAQNGDELTSRGSAGNVQHILFPRRYNKLDALSGNNKNKWKRATRQPQLSVFR
jgi:hypothetical protein